MGISQVPTTNFRAHVPTVEGYACEFNSAAVKHHSGNGWKGVPLVAQFSEPLQPEMRAKREGERQMEMKTKSDCDCDWLRESIQVECQSTRGRFRWQRGRGVGCPISYQLPSSPASCIPAKGDKQK